MAAFTLDTSGEVYIPDARFPEGATRIRWSDLSPFVQGYIEPVLRQMFEFAVKPDGAPFGFSDFAPEAVALILRDGATFENIAAGLGATALGAREGRYLWEGRNNGALKGAFAAAFPPLTPYLDDAGRVNLRGAA